jgi:hypothetical protein
VAQVVKHLPSKLEALIPNPSTQKKKKEKERLTMFLLLLSALHTDYVNIMSYILLSFPFYRVGK